jgi:hypothetical protein
MATLPEPSLELATAVLRTVEYDERLAGFTLDGTTGHTAQDLYNLESVARFLRSDPLEMLLGGPGGRGLIRYLDLNILSRWVVEVLGDSELAAAIRAAAAQETAYARQIVPVEALLQEILQQCRAVLEPEAKKTEEETGGPELPA